MAEALLSILPLEFALEKLIGAVGQQIAMYADATDEHEKLSDTFQSIRAVLRDAESRQVTDDLVRLWLSKLKHVAYDIEYWLDEWQISGLGSEGCSDDGGGIRNKVRSFLLSPYNRLDQAFSHYKVARRMKEFQKRLTEIDGEKNKYGLTSSVGGDQWTLEKSQLPTTSLMDESEMIIGREDDKETVVSKLVSGSSHEDDQVRVVAVVGIGGQGKTTLARKIYNDSRVKDHFNGALYWVWVSQDFDVARLTKVVLERVKKTSNFASENLDSQQDVVVERVQKASTSVSEDLDSQQKVLLQAVRMLKQIDIVSTPLTDLESLQNELLQALKGKRFLLVLDDVWVDDADKWKALRLPLKSDAKGSKILVTTRSDKVAETMNPAYTHQLQGLSEEHSWTLFSSKAFAGRQEEYSQLESIGREIVNNCKGVPLSIKVMGAAMHSKRTDEDWRNILNSKIWCLPQVTEKLLPALLLSYFNLPAHLKHCFTYCAIFPKDRALYKDICVKLWLSLGFIQSQGSRNEEDISEEYFDELVAWSMLQQVGDEGTTYEMHDLLHDVAKFLVEDEIYTISEDVKSDKCPRNVRHALLSFTGNNDKHDIPIALRRAQKLRTLFLGGVDGSDSVIVGLFHQARFLRVLFFAHSKTLPASIGKFKHLRYLNLHSSMIVELPNAIGKLKQLRYLDLRFTNIVELPDVIGKLKHLTYLALSWSKIVELPDVIGKLKHLSYLGLAGTKIVKLPESVGHLPNLHTLDLDFCDELKELPTGIGGTVRLRHLRISGTDSLECLPKGLGRITSLKTLNKFIVGIEEGTRIDELQRLKLLQGTLKIGKLERVSGREEAEKADLRNKPNIRSLMLGMTEIINLSEFEMIFGDEKIEMPEALKPEIERMNSVLEGLRPHPNLEELIIFCVEVSNLPSWIEDGSSFPNLTSLKIFGVPYCKNLPVLVKLPKIERLDMMGLLWWESSSEAEANVIMPSLRHLTVGICPKLEALPHYLARSPLTKLKIENCERIKGTGCSSFPSLEEFTLEKCSEFLSSGELPDLPKLKEFLIKDMANKTLPDGGWERLVALRKLEIRDCKELKSLPDGLTQLHSLENLGIFGCIGLESLPEGLGQLKTLKSLEIDLAQELTYLPDSLAQLESLEYLHIGGLRKLQLISEGLGQLKKLISLTMSDAEELTCLPDSLGQLESLETLRIDGLKKLQSLPEWLGQLKKLKELMIGGLTVLTCLPDSLAQQKSLEHFKIIGWERLESLPLWLRQLEKLKSLAIESMEALTCVPDSLGQLESLKNLDISHCKRLKSLPPGLGQLKSLQRLTIGGWNELKSLPRWLGKLKALEYLTISDCTALRSLPDGLQDLRLLRELRISGCPLLLERCKRVGGKDWPKISHIEDIKIED